MGQYVLKYFQGERRDKGPLVQVKWAFCLKKIIHSEVKYFLQLGETFGQQSAGLGSFDGTFQQGSTFCQKTENLGKYYSKVF